MSERLNVAVIGAGYWGPNLARNFRAGAEWNLVAICDLDEQRARGVADSVGGVPVTSDLNEVLRDPQIDAIAIATPARTHHAIVLAALDAGKHVMVEKPLADTRDRGVEMVRRAEERGLVLMADHTYCYTPAVLKIRELDRGGSARGHPVRGQRAHQPRTHPARRRRLLGPRAARPVDHGLRAPRRARGDVGLGARLRSAAAPASPASATSRCRWSAARWPTCTSTG